MTLLDDRFSYDPNGNLTVQDDALNLAGGDRWMSYDGRDRLLSAQINYAINDTRTETFTYDALDNITSRQFAGQTSTYSYNSVTRLLNSITGPGGTQSFNYDPRGNMISRASLSHTFDRANRLTAVSGKGTFEYDGHGRRTVSWRADGTGKTDLYTLDGVLRWTGDNRLRGNRVYIHLGSQLVAEHYSPWAGGETIEYVHGDLVGSSVARTTSTGVITERERSLSYGQALDGQKREAPGFTGHMEDPSLGLVYMQQRYYDPAIGRFLSVDPVGPLQNPINHFGRYHYANNNPYKYTDPDGRLAFCLVPVGPMQACAAAAAALGKAVVVVGTAAAAAYAGSEAIDQYKEATEETEDQAEGPTRKLGDLETIHDPDHPQNNPEIADLTDEELDEVINDPSDGQKVKVRGNRVLDGNTRINEAKKRGWPDDKPIPVEESPELPDNVDEEPLGPYGDLYDP